MAENYGSKRRGMGGPMGHGPMGAVEKAKDFKGTLKKLMKYLEQYHLAMVFVVIFAIGSTIFNIVGPKILGKATTEIATGLYSGNGIDFDKIEKFLLILIFLYIFSAVFGYIQGFIMTGISQKTAFRMRKEISQKLNRLPMNYYDKRTYGEILSRITNDVDTLGMNLNQTMSQLVTSVTTIIGVLIMMLTISPIMTLVALLMLPISAFLIGMIMKSSQKYFKEQQEYLGHVNGQVEEVFGGHNVVKLFNREEAALNEFSKNNNILFVSAWKSQFFSGMAQPVMAFVGNLGYASMALLGGFLTIKNIIEVGDIVSFIQYIRQFTQPIQQLAQVSNMMQSTLAAAERVFEFLEEEEEELIAKEHAVIVEDGIERKVTGRDLIGNVTFEHVKFGYYPDKIIIKDFSVSVKKGQKIAIVGATGAGKTTLVKLLMRFYDVNEGSIGVDGYNIKDFDRHELRDAFGMVLQDTWLFKGSIMENIRYGRLDATDEEVIAAAKAAHADHFIRTLPGGYQMELNEETTNISQGQKQLLTIARAILADNKILILDEATSSVDTRTEVRIQKAMDNLMKGRTSFVIAHRLSTIRDADVILVMKDGDVIEQGNHENLMQKNGAYASLYNSQFECA